MKHLYRIFTLFAVLTLTAQVSRAQYTVKGTVKDESGATLPGVNVLIKGSNTGVITDIEGQFSVATRDNNPVTLLVSFVGYRSKEVAVTQQNSDNVQVVLQEDTRRLEEVVITGLASSVKRSNLANAVSTVSAEELTGTTQLQTLDNALYGKLTGANITASGGAPGGGLSVQLRGLSTLQGTSQPLYIIDGVYVNNTNVRNGRATVTGAGAGAGAAAQDDASNRLADLNPDDIASIEVLKGPSAAAIYGTRANAGVIIITTKRGKAGKTNISFGQDLGFAKAQRFMGVDDWSEEKINFFFPAARREVELQRFRAANGNFINYEEFFYGNTALLSNSRLSVSGGNDKTRFLISGNLTDEDGIVRKTGFQRRSVRANVDHKLWDRIDISVSSNYLNTNTDRGFTGNQNNTGASIGYNIAYVPNYFDLRPNAQGIYPVNPYFAENPIAVTDKGVNNLKVNRFIQAFSIGADLFKTSNSFLKLSVQGGVDYTSSSSLVYLPEDLQFQRAQANPGDAFYGKQENLNTNIQAFLVYNWNIGKLNMNSQIGTVRLNFQENNLFTRGRGLAPGQRNLLQATVQEIAGQAFQNISEVGAVAQQEANFDDKIIGTLGVRFDKSTLNGDPNRFFAFPKASLAVNVANFDFWSIKPINAVKPRIAYGETAGPVPFGATFTALNGVNIGGLLGGAVTVSPGNRLIEPERASELEFGVDMGFLDNKITLEATYYIKNTRNNLQPLSLSPASGAVSILSNGADLQNKGIELTLGATVLDKSNIKWNTRVMYWQNRLNMTRLDIPFYTQGGFGAALGTYLYRQGFSPTTIVGTPQLAPGEFTIWGDNQPDFQMSFFNQINFLKNFDFSFLLHWKQGGDNINLTSFLTDSGGTTKGWFNDDNGDGIPNGRQRPPEPFNNAGRWVQDASYLRLREIALYYTIPQSTISSFAKGIERVKVGVSGNNIWTLTKYEGYDPETSTFGANIANGAGVDIAPYPTTRRMFFHLLVDF